MTDARPDLGGVRFDLGGYGRWPDGLACPDDAVERIHLPDLRAAADSLVIDTAIWVARDPGEPLEFQPEAMAARDSALRTIDETIGQLRQLRRELTGGAHRARGRHA